MRRGESPERLIVDRAIARWGDPDATPPAAPEVSDEAVIAAARREVTPRAVRARLEHEERQAALQASAERAQVKRVAPSAAKLAAGLDVRTLTAVERGELLDQLLAFEYDQGGVEITPGPAEGEDEGEEAWTLDDTEGYTLDEDGDVVEEGEAA